MILVKIMLKMIIMTIIFFIITIVIVVMMMVIIINTIQWGTTRHATKNLSSYYEYVTPLERYQTPGH